METDTSEKFETSNSLVQEINNFTTNIKMSMEADQDKNMEVVKNSIDDIKLQLSNQKKDLEDKLDNSVIKIEVERKEQFDGEWISL